MDMGNLISRVEEAGSELRARALRCESVDKLVELAEENSIELTKEEAEQLFSIIRKGEGELSAAELDLVTGGVSKPRCPNCESCWTALAPRQPGRYRCMVCDRTFTP